MSRRLTWISTPRRCYFAIVQHHKGFTWVCATNHIQTGPCCDSWALVFLWAIHFSPHGAVSMAQVVLGQGAAGNGQWNGVVSFRTSPPSREMLAELDVPLKVFWFFPYKLWWLIDVTAFYCKLNNCTHYAVLRILNNCVGFCFLSSMAMTCSLDRTCKKEANLKPEWM